MKVIHCSSNAQEEYYFKYQITHDARQWLIRHSSGGCEEAASGLTPTEGTATYNWVSYTTLRWVVAHVVCYHIPRLVAWY